MMVPESPARSPTRFNRLNQRGSPVRITRQNQLPESTRFNRLNQRGSPVRITRQNQLPESTRFYAAQGERRFEYAIKDILI